MRFKKFVVLLVLATLFIGAVGIQAQEIDFEGETVTFLCNWEFIDPEGEDAKEIMEDYNIGEINMLTVPWGEIYDTAMSRLLSGESEYDVWFLGHTFPHPLLKEDALYPISEILGMEYYEKLPESKQVIAEAFTLDQDRRYVIPDTDAEFIDSVFVYWNKNIFESQGLQNPFELYQQGEWTYEAMEEIAKNATIENEDGEIEQWGIARLHHKDWMLTNGGNYLEWEDGKLKLGFDERHREAISVLKEWHNDDEILKSADYADDAAMHDTFVSGDAAMTASQPWELWPGQMEDDWSIVPMPKGPQAEDYSFMRMTTNSFFLPTNTAAPEKMVALIEALYPMDEYEYNVENSVRDYAPDEETVEVLMDYNEGPVAHSYYESIFVVDEFWGTMYDIVNSEKSVSTGFEEVRPVIEANIEEYNQYITGN
ncbi:MAG: ABC transporter substrate-binding protein [bacterium]